MTPKAPQDPFNKFWAQIAAAPSAPSETPGTVINQLVGTVTGHLIIMGEVTPDLMQLVLAAAQKPTESTRQ